MRTVQTFVLRLIVNASEPGALRGVIRYVAIGEEWLFASRQELLRLLGEIAHPPAALEGSIDSEYSLEGNHENQPDPADLTSS